MSLNSLKKKKKKTTTKKTKKNKTKIIYLVKAKFVFLEILRNALLKEIKLKK